MSGVETLPRIDWGVAATVGRSLVPPGPALPDEQAAAVVRDLRAAAARATDLVARATGLPGPADSEVLVVDRRSWVSANVGMAETMIERVRSGPVPDGLRARVAGRLAGAQVGGVFALVATRILGQFDPFSSPRRLLLVAPNVVSVERAMGVDPADFRLWVCLHEETHRFQFGAAPWLSEHLLGLMAELLGEGGATFAGWSPGKPVPAVADLLLSPSQRDTFGQITAVMSLMEGHADVAMDEAAHGVIPSLRRLRELFELRRDAPGLAQVIGRLLGLNLKREQYREGAAFCRAVIARIGHEGLNQVFESRGLLPSLAELRDPPQWLHRMGA